MGSFSETIFSVVDCETTGLDPAVDRVVEFAIVRCGNTGVGGNFTQLFDPGIPIPPAASAIHHIVDADVRGLGLFSEFEIIGLDGNNIPHAYAAHNAAFDSQFIPQIKGEPMICTMRLAKKLWPELDGYGNQFLRYQFGLYIPDEIKALGMHRAMPDAYVTACLLVRELAELAKQHSEIGTVEQLVEWLSNPILLYRCNFGKHGPKNGQPGTLWKDVPRDYLKWMLGNMSDMDEDTRYTANFYYR